MECYRKYCFLLGVGLFLVIIRVRELIAGVSVFKHCRVNIYIYVHDHAISGDRHAYHDNLPVDDAMRWTTESSHRRQCILNDQDIPQHMGILQFSEY